MNLRELQEERANLITEMETSLETRDMDGFKAKEARVEEIDGLIAGIEKTRALKETKKEQEDGVKMNLREEILKGNEIKVRAISAGVSTGGNVAVGDKVIAEDWDTEIVKKAKYISPLLDSVDVVVTSSDRNIPIQGTKLGKFVKTKELATYVEQNATYEKKKLEAVKLTNFVVISEELLADSDYDLESDIKDQLVEAYGETMDELLVVGNSADGDDIQGLNTFAETNTCGGVKKVSENDIIEMYYALPEKYRKTAKWVMNDMTAKELSKLTDSNGRPLLYNSFNTAGIANGSFIYGCPVIINNNVAPVTAATAGKCLFFGDLKKALKVGIRKGLTIKKSEEVKWLEDAIALKASFRADSKTILDEAMVVLKSKIS